MSANKKEKIDKKLKLPKVCKTCKEDLTSDNTYSEKFYYCKPCWRQYMKEHRIKHLKHKPTVLQRLKIVEKKVEEILAQGKGSEQ